MSGGPDLFVICKSCGSEVSPYITECPYCGNRLRKRAPKLDRGGQPSERPGRRRPPSPTLGRLRRGEIPGIRAESHPYATFVLVGLGVAGALLWRTALLSPVHLIAYGSLQTSTWRVFTTPFIYDNTGFAFLALVIIALYGTLLERRHGPLVVIGLFLLGGPGAAAVSLEASPHVVLGANGAALALLIAWAMQDLLTLRARQEIDGDLLATAVLGTVMALIPLAAVDASWISDAVGVLAGVVVGYPLARLRPA